MNKFKVMILCLISFSFIGCDARIRDFGKMSDNPCEDMYCKQHEDGTSICIIKCKDGLYGLKSDKLKLNNDYKSYQGRLK